MAERESVRRGDPRRSVNGLPKAWKAVWIDPEGEHDPEKKQPAAVLRKRFHADRTEEAKLYITCHGLYEARLNGRRVGDFVLAPGTGDYIKQLKAFPRAFLVRNDLLMPYNPDAPEPTAEQKEQFAIAEDLASGIKKSILSKQLEMKD